MEKALLVIIKLKSERDSWSLEDTALELEELAQTSGAEAVDTITCICERPTANLFIGKGKAEEIALFCQEENIQTVVFSRDLSGTQQRNLEEVIGRKTIDRTQLILDIFARHARSPEGKMQVELAQLQYLLPRLVGKGIILSRLGGGIGTRGPGEQKLEIDRRRIRKRIDKLKDDLEHFALHRQVIKNRRKENAIASAALVGYTNAGKSTLINALANAQQVVSDGLFTTLDPLSKKLILPNGEHVIISDTVGFLHRLPHHLIEAFKATLEEVMDADLLIHVLDVTHAKVHEHNQAVFEVLVQLESEDKPLITALNKIDLLQQENEIDKLKNDFANPVTISAKTGENLQVLLERIQENFTSRMVDLDLIVPLNRMDLIDRFYREGRVKNIDYLPDGIRTKVSLPVILSQKLLSSNEIKKTC